jgi:hypothetical protein
MFDTLLVANCGERVRTPDLSAKPERLVREAHAGDLVAIGLKHV